MAKRKKGGKKKGANRNSAAVKSTRPAANKKVRNSAKPKTHKKGGFKGRRNGSSFFSNPLSSGKLFGIDLIQAGGIGTGVLTAKASDILMPANDWPGIGLQGALAFAFAYFGKKSPFVSNVGLGIAAIAIYNAANKLSNNAIESTVLSTVQRFRPVMPQQLPSGNGTGMAGMGQMRGYPQRRAVVSW